ncbi:hypothetical protein PoB_000206500 [Plakobranchus ocellatus]|uniref:Uncharacterized protein n=1 Tax=Plakobranchus ocellatus TaxID=259542 RepID=A0AAV3XXN7_9GAST|nr:hypothetical protein PoB_000206500 [Plakobranchus ocellatus]
MGAAHEKTNDIITFISGVCLAVVQLDPGEIWTLRRVRISGGLICEETVAAGGGSGSGCTAAAAVLLLSAALSAGTSLYKQRSIAIGLRYRLTRVSSLVWSDTYDSLYILTAYLSHYEAMAFLPTFRLSSHVAGRLPSQEQSGERKRAQPSPSPGWQDQPPSRSASRSACHPTTGNDVTRIDIYPDSNGNPATRCSEQKSGVGLSAKPPRSSFPRPGDHGSRNSSAQRNNSRKAAFSASHPSRSADHTSRTQNASSDKSNKCDHKEQGEGCYDDDGGGGGEADGDSGSGVYCIIRSGITPRARANRQVPNTLTKHQFRQVCSRPHQAVVFTADTASLLLQSGPPLLIRPAADVYFHRSAARSAIQRVTDANYFTDLQGVPRSKSGIEGSSRRRLELYRGRLAPSRSGSIQSEDFHLPHQDAQGAKSGNPPVKCLQRTVSEDTLYRTGSAEVKRKCIDPQQVPYISRDSSATSVSCRQTKQIQQTRSEASNTATALNMASKQYSKKNAQRNLRLGQHSEIPTGNQKTLSPSKHGFHPRSHSPTFKRLIAASERLQEAQSTANDSCQKAASESSGPWDVHNYYGSSSSDSLRGFPTFGQEIIDSMFEANQDSNNSNVSKHNQSNTKNIYNTTSPPRVIDRGAKAVNKQVPTTSQDTELPVGGRGRLREARDDRSKISNRLVRQRHDVSYDRQRQTKVKSEASPPSSLPVPSNPHTQPESKRKARVPGPCNGDSAIPDAVSAGGQQAVEIEARVRDGQPTQLHFFLPQLADGVSDGSGGTLTGRSNYCERRLELLDWRDSRGSAADGGLHHDSSAAGPGGGILDDDEDLDPTTTTTITEISTHKFSNSKDPSSLHRNQYYPHSDPHHLHQAIRDPPVRAHGHRGRSKERVTAYDLKNGHLTLNRGRRSPQSKEEGANATQKQRRQISPLRAAPKPERPPRTRRANNSPFRAPVYLESQLPSEKLKKQIEDFPTLVSMDFSDTDTSLQVR